ncbi:hypothetical protein GYMLUDRAFT_215061 [Collybiopsis luxurians FD-317 M1]|nr:hypothetical protein GYMLUDRAFT_215061 [Collybiopsis luxurians FD-317 M1]
MKWQLLETSVNFFFFHPVGSQVNELNIIRQSLYELEAQHGKVRQQYEDELARLRSEIHSLRQSGGGIPPSSSHGTGIIGPGSAGPQSSSGGVPPFNDPYFPRERDRERDARDRERNERIERDRERETLRDRDRDRVVDSRDPKRLKGERMKPERPDLFSPASMPKLPPPGASSGTATSSGPGQSSSGPGLPPSAPSHGGPLATHPPPGPGSAATSPMIDNHPPANGGAVVPINTPGGGFPDDIDLASLPPEYKREGTDWFIMYNPKVEKAFNIGLTHTLMHESVVCCVRFSADGRYLATGCNRTAQIYDVKTGFKTCVLVDDTVGKSGDLYIRSVCFSPDGKFLATGAEDKQIRIWDIQRKKIRNIFDGHQQEIYSLDFSADGRLIVSGSGDKTARIWDMIDGTSKVLTINDPDSLNNDAGVTSVAISPNGQFVAAGSLDTVVRIWDVATGMLVERLRGHRDSVYSVAFTPDGKGLVSGSLDKTLKYWDVGALMANGVKGRKEGANGAGPSGPNGSSALVKRDGDKQSQCTMNFMGHKDYVLSVAVSHDGHWVVSGSKDRGVQFWDSKTAVVQAMLQGHKNSGKSFIVANFLFTERSFSTVISIDLSPTANILATGSGDWQARIWSYN